MAAAAVQRMRPDGPGYDTAPVLSWRHLGLAELRIWLRYAPPRVCRRRFGIRSETVPWAAPASRFTRDFEELAAYLDQVTDQTQVTRMLGIAWGTVGAIVASVVRAPWIRRAAIACAASAWTSLAPGTATGT